VGKEVRGAKGVGEVGNVRECPLLNRLGDLAERCEIPQRVPG